MLKSLLLTAALLCAAPLSYANQVQPDPKAALKTEMDAKYEGIEITVNINTASAQELADLLKGIGIKKAQAIVKYREQHGEFADAKALTKVKGIGDTTVARNQARIKL